MNATIPRTALLTLALFQAFGAASASAQDATFPAGESWHVHGQGADTLRYRMFVPEHRSEARPPLLVMLHGCTQDAADIAAGTRLDEAAAEHGVLVAYPEQPAGRHPQRCWNWYDPAHQLRGAGEPARIAALTREVVARAGADPSRVYIAGISAGGAMAVQVAAAYPDVYAAVASHSGMEYRAADGVTEALAALQGGGPDPDVQGEAAHAAMREHARPLPVMVVHGLEDAVVRPVNGRQTVAQWLRTNHLAGARLTGPATSRSEPDAASPSSHAFTVETYRDADGRAFIEAWFVEGMGHAWSGGSADGSYTDPAGPDVTRALLRFLLAHRHGG